MLTANLLLAAWVTFRVDGEGPRDPVDDIALYRTVLEEVHDNYVDADRVPYDRLVSSSLRGMLSDLDPYSQFLDAGAHRDMQEESRGEFGGIGITVSMREGTPTVISPIEGTPAFEAGVLPGDRIVHVNGTKTEGLSLSEAIDLMRGEVDSTIRMGLQAEDREEVREVSMVRRVIKMPTVRDARMIDAMSGIGYLRLTQFSDPSAEDLRAALRDLRDEGMRALVLDLRGNPGGLLKSAVDVADLFLAGKPLIVSIRGRDPDPDRARGLHGEEGSDFEDLPMAVLVDDGSASASEIVAGALKDHGRAKLVGEKTFGKGSVQRVIPIHGEDGPALRLTTAKYYTNSGQVIHGVGIEPDIEVEMTNEERAELLRYQNRPGEFESRPPDPQLEKAVELLSNSDAGRA